MVSFCQILPDPCSLQSQPLEEFQKHPANLLKQLLSSPTVFNYVAYKVSPRTTMECPNFWMSPNAKTLYSLFCSLWTVKALIWYRKWNWLLQAWVQIQHVENVKAFHLNPLKQYFHAAAFQTKQCIQPQCVLLPVVHLARRWKMETFESESKSWSQFTRREQVLFVPWYEEKHRNTMCWKPSESHKPRKPHHSQHPHESHQSYMSQSQVLHMLYVLNAPNKKYTHVDM